MLMGTTQNEHMKWPNYIIYLTPQKNLFGENYTSIQPFESEIVSKHEVVNEPGSHSLPTPP